MKRMARLALAAAILAFASQAQSEMIVRKTVTYFSIGGKTAADLDREMAAHGPLLTTGRRHPGATRVTFSGKASYVSEEGRCSIGEARIVLTTKMMLPRWKNRTKADARMALLWDTLSADIKRHEERHAEIARNHARALEKALAGAQTGKQLRGSQGQGGTGHDPGRSNLTTPTRSDSIESKPPISARE